MAKLSRRELVRVAGGMTAAHAVGLDAQAPVRPAYIGPLTGVTTDLQHATCTRPPRGSFDSARAIAAKPRPGRKRSDRS